jgi:hypothetical protein
LTTIATRTGGTPAVIDGEFTAIPDGANPYAFCRTALRVLVAGLGASTVWLVLRGEPWASLSFALLFAAIVVLAGVVGRFEAWEQAR